MTLTRRVLTAAGLLALAAAATLATTAGAEQVAYKPVIAKPVTTPVQALAGKPLVVTFKVTRSDTGAPLLRGKMICDPSLAGKMLAHKEAFRAGIARLSFLVPASAAGKQVKVKLTIKAAGGGTATRVSYFKVAAAAKPSLAIADASVVEGNAGTTALSVPVTLSAASTQSVSVQYQSADGTAKAGSDYVAASGTLTFAPGQTTKAIVVSVSGDTAIEQDETFTVSLTNPVNATIADGSATGTITNDDTQVPVTPGSYKGATQNGDYVFLTVLANRTLTGFRVNNVQESCSPGGIYLTGAINWSDNVWTIGADGSFTAEGSWSGSDVQGNVEWTNWYAKVTGQFSGTTVNGTLVISDELNYGGTHFKCSTGQKTWSATLSG